MITLIALWINSKSNNDFAGAYLFTFIIDLVIVNSTMKVIGG
jgi:hypothetical protein